MRLLCVAAALVPIVLVPAACAGDSSGPGARDTATTTTTTSDRPDGRAWAEVACTSGRQWFEEIRDRLTDAQESLTSATPEEVRRVTAGLLDGIAESGERMLRDVDSVGAPDVELGEDAHDAFASLLERAVDAVAAARDELEAIEPGDRRRIARELPEIVDRMLRRIDEADEVRVDDAVQRQLDELVDGVADCGALRVYVDL